MMWTQGAADGTHLQPLHDVKLADAVAHLADRRRQHVEARVDDRAVASQLRQLRLKCGVFNKGLALSILTTWRVAYTDATDPNMSHRYHTHQGFELVYLLNYFIFLRKRNGARCPAILQCL
jgi:hypothetical protein